MNKTLTAVATALTLLATYPVMAAEKTAEPKPATATAETCKSLETQFDTAAKAHMSSPKYKEAETMRQDGAKLCGEGKYAEGTAKLHQAFKELGLKVMHKAY